MRGRKGCRGGGDDLGIRFNVVLLWRDAIARHDAMQVRMVDESLAPAVQHRDEADLGA
jgi:hypothetical protein